MTDTPPKPDSFGDSSTDPIDSDDFKFEKTKVDEDSAKERLGRDIYTDETQAFEELYSNSVTALYEASERGYIDIDEAIIRFDIDIDEDGNVMLRAWDNGIGMDEETVRDVFLNFGITTGGSKEDVVAQFGMGVASYPNLVGFHDGRIYMETNARYSDDAVYGYYTIDGLSYKTGTDELRLLGEETYGTAFELWLREDISLSDVKSWIKRVSGYNEIPIQVSYPNGNEEVISPSTVYDKFDTSESIFIEYEDEEIGRFVAGMNVPEDTVLIHREVKFNLGKNSSDTPPFKDNVFMRLYTESEKVCAGEHKGKLVVDDLKYEQQSGSLKEKYVPKSKVPENVPVTPRVVGNREKLADDTGFGDWVVNKLRQEYYSRVEELLDDINSASDYFHLSSDDRRFLKFVLSDNAFSYSYRYNRFGQKMKDKYTPESTRSILNSKHTSEEYDVDENTAKILSAMFDTNDIMETYNTDMDEIGYKLEYARRSLNTTVYMGVSINSKKKRVVIDDDPNAIVVQVRNADCYDRYETAFGWEKLKQVKKGTLDEYDISEETKNLFKNKTKGVSDSDDDSLVAPAEELTVHYGRRHIQKKKMTAQFIENSLNEGKPNEIHSLPIIAFPDNGSKNISDFYNFARRSAGLFKCTNETWSALQEYEQVKHIESVLSEHRSITAMTNEGEDSVLTALVEENYYVLLIPDSHYQKYVDMFGAQEAAKRFKRVMADGSFGRNRRSRPSSSSTIMLLPESKLKDNHFILHGITPTKFYTLGDASVSTDLIDSMSDWSWDGYDEIKAHLLLAEWTHTEMYEEIVNNILNFDNRDRLLMGIRQSMGDNNFRDAPSIDEVEFNL